MDSELMSAKGERSRRPAELPDRGLAPMLAAAWLAVLLVVMYTQLTPWPDTVLLTDFHSFWTAGTMVKQGAGSDLYNLDRQQDVQVRLRQDLGTQDVTRQIGGLMRFHNPPPLALLFVPLASLQVPWAFLAWSVVTLLACVAAVAPQLRGASFGGSKAVAILSTIGLVDNLLWGQVSGLFLLALSLGMLALARGHRATGGAMLGLLWLKPQHAPLFALVLLAKARWRELAGMAFTGLILAGVSLAMVGLEGIRSYVALIGSVGGFYQPKGASIGPELMVNWRAVLIHLWPGVSEGTGYATMLGLGAVTVLAALLAWRGEWKPDSGRFPLQMLATTLATLVATPHSHLSGTVLLMAPPGPGDEQEYLPRPSAAGPAPAVGGRVSPVHSGVG